MTIGELTGLYEKNYVINLKSRRNISRRLARYMAPWASLELAALTRMQVIAWHQEIGHTHGFTGANQALQTLHALYVKALDWELYDGRNPADRIKKFPNHSRARFIQTHEMPVLLTVLSKERPQVEAFVLCLLFTGCRVGELRAAKWADFDLEQGLWNKPTSKNGTPHTVPLAAVLLPRLRQLPRHTVWVFPSRPNRKKNGGQAGQWGRASIRYLWERLRRRAGLPDVRMHDLRRTTASWLSCNGANLPVIQAVLNHKSLASTQVYARLSVEPVRRALDEQATRMLGPMPVENSVPVPVPFVSVSEQRLEWPG